MGKALKSISNVRKDLFSLNPNLQIRDQVSHLFPFNPKLNVKKIQAGAELGQAQYKID